MSVAVSSARAAEPIPHPPRRSGADASRDTACAGAEPGVDAVPPMPRSSASWVVLRLSRLVARHDVVRLAALLPSEPSREDTRPPIWPLAATLPHGALPLAAHAFAAGRITRVPVPMPALGIAELLALPLGAGELPGTLLLALDVVDDNRREALVADARRCLASARALPRSSGEATRESSGPPGSRDAPDGHGERGETQTSRSAHARGEPVLAAAAPDIACARTALDRAALDALAEHGDGRSVALAVADRAASAFGCRRVTLGVAGRRGARLLAVSGESRPDTRRRIGRALTDVVAEALAHGEGRWPDADAAIATVTSTRTAAHRRLHEGEDGLSVLSIVHGSASGERVVAVLEGSPGGAFGARDADGARDALAGALALTGELETRSRGAPARLSANVRRALDGPRGERVPWRAVAFGIALVALALAALVPLPYRVGARVVVEASDRQVLVAPEAGHIRTAHARAGDAVAAGELLATLDERELVLSLERWRSELAKNEAEQSRALATRDRVELARLHADARRLEAELARVEARRARGEIRAPFAGVVLAGDPTRSLGAPVAAGEVLFEIGAGERELSVQIDGRDVGLVAAGARTRVRMAASPRDVHEARLAPIVPVAVDEDGREVFRVPAVLLDEGVSLSPGMEGVARIDAGRRTPLDAWTRPLRETLLLLGWRLGLVR